MKVTAINQNQSFKGKPPILQTQRQITNYLSRRVKIDNASKRLETASLAGVISIMVIGALKGSSKNGVADTMINIVGGGSIAAVLASFVCKLKSIKMYKFAHAAQEALNDGEEFRRLKNTQKVRSKSMAISRRLKRQNQG